VSAFKEIADKISTAETIVEIPYENSKIIEVTLCGQDKWVAVDLQKRGVAILSEQEKMKVKEMMKRNEMKEIFRLIKSMVPDNSTIERRSGHMIG